jgi:DNA-binding NarL/FixJ family response regulator
LRQRNDTGGSVRSCCDVRNEREGRLRVLVADDNDDVRDGIVELLDPVFEIVAAVSSGRELVDTAVALEPDVIVSDQAMPSLTGTEALAMLRAAGYTIPFVLQTITGENAQAWLDVGALGVVDKFDLASDLVTAVRSAAAGKVFLSRSITRAR